MRILRPKPTIWIWVKKPPELLYKWRLIEEELYRPRLAITQVQHKQNNGTGSTSVTWTAPTTAGNLLRAIVCVTKTGGTQGTVTVPTGFGWLLAVSKTETSAGICAIYYAPNEVSHVSSGVWGSTQAANLVSVQVEEISGLANGGALDKTASNSNTTIPWTSGTTATTTQAAEYMCAGVNLWDNVNGPDTFNTPTNSFTITQQQTMSDLVGSCCDLSRIVSSTGTFSTGSAVSGVNPISWASVIATFKDGVAATPQVHYSRRNKAIRGLPQILATW